MGWRDHVTRTDDHGDDAKPWETSYTCDICDTPLGGSGPASTHVREKHPDHLAASDGDEDPDPEPEQGDEAPSTGEPAAPDPEPGKPSADGSPSGGSSGEPSAPTPDEGPASSTWRLDRVDVSDRPDPRRDPPGDEDAEQAPEQGPHAGGQPQAGPQADGEQAPAEDGQETMSPDEAHAFVEALLPVAHKRFNAICERHGVEPITDEEEARIKTQAVPVVQKYVPTYGPEVGLATTMLLVYGSRVYEIKTDPSPPPGSAPKDEADDDQGAATDAQPEPTAQAVSQGDPILADPLEPVA